MNRRRQGGFTLIELLVGMTLLGFIIVAVAGGLRIGIAGTDRVTTRAAQLDELRGVHGFLRERLEAARPIRWTDERGRSVIAFDGRQDRLAFVSDMPAFPDIGGLYKLVVVRAGDDLVLKRELTEGRVSGFDTANAASDVLVRDIGALGFSYFGSPDARGEPAWSDTWQDARGLPELIRIEISTGGPGKQMWPAIIVTPRLGEQPR
ncbi:MAG: prepilin-type N-terminal cleavage/methylation domain-containing protein [Alphaproteobacteria bacterium]|nr:prepilin-type N-terminal cleavage/methylation domain-containing protein [Alphaproteobacteria bacterium]